MKAILGAILIIVGVMMTAYGVDHYFPFDNSLWNWLLSDGGVVVVFVGAVITGKALIALDTRM